MAAISLRSPFGARDHALIRFDLLTGLRVGELVALDVGHVWRPDGGPRDWLDLPASACKGQRGRQIPLCPDAQQAVRDLLAFLRLRGFSTAPGAPLLTDRRHRRLPAREVQRAVQRYRERAGLDLRVTPHTLRHTFASRLVDAGVNPRAIQVLLGHECLSSTEVYLHNRPAALVRAKAPRRRRRGRDWALRKLRSLKQIWANRSPIRTIQLCTLRIVMMTSMHLTDDLPRHRMCPQRRTQAGRNPKDRC